MKKVFFLFALAILALGSVRLSAADSTPSDGALGLGTLISADMLNYNLGAVGALNVGTNFQIGMKLGFAYNSLSNNNSYTAYAIGPYGRYYLGSMKSLRPFVDAGLQIGSYGKINGDYTLIKINLGGEWNPYKTVGVLAGFSFFSYESNQSIMSIGLGAPFIGALWYF